MPENIATDSSAYKLQVLVLIRERILGPAHNFEYECLSFLELLRIPVGAFGNESLTIIQSIYVGISGLSECPRSRVGISIRDAAYLVDYLEYEFIFQEEPVPYSAICDSIIAELKKYSRTYLEKVIGVAFPKEVHSKVPNLCSRLWMELDCIPLVLDQHRRSRQRTDQGNFATFRGWSDKSLDEQADSMARKCIRYFGVGNIPYFDIGVGGSVEVDSSFHMHLAGLKDFEKTVTSQTWSLAQYYAADLKKRGVKIAIFSTTPQVNTSANTKSALVRLSHCLGTDIRWYVPDPAPRVSCIIRKMQNMLQGNSTPGEDLTADEELQLLNWVYGNAKHHWLCYNGPLRPAQEGGVDVVIIDDPFLSALALISKQHDPKRPVIFHSHLNIHNVSDISADVPQSKVFDFLWSTLQHVDILACQALSTLESRLIPRKKVGYMLASLDNFDGLNKKMNDFDIAFYGRQFNASCRDLGTISIHYPDDVYILVPIPCKPSFQRILYILEAYREFCNHTKTYSSAQRLPKLLVCGRHAYGHMSEEFYDCVTAHIAVHMNDLLGLISVNKVKPPDQLWNTLLSNSAFVILPPDPGGFEEGFLEVIYKGKPVITTEKLGRYLSLVNNQLNVFPVEIADVNSMAEHISKVWFGGQTQQQGNSLVPNNTWDEVTTVGNAVNWLFLASELSKGDIIQPNGEYIYQLAHKGTSS
ncbi:unnamed protein product [Penicillium nalgiovense]|nr:unnamed protein product [Penicillium nalgiovense]